MYALPPIEPRFRSMKQERPASRRFFGESRTIGYTGHVPGIAFLDESIGRTFPASVEAALHLGIHNGTADVKVWEGFVHTMPKKRIEGPAAGFTGHIPGVYGEGLFGQSNARLSENRKLMTAKYTPWITTTRDAYISFSPGYQQDVSIPLHRGADSKLARSIAAATFSASKGRKEPEFQWVNSQYAPQYTFVQLKELVRKKILERRGCASCQTAFHWMCHGFSHGVTYDAWMKCLHEIGMGNVFREKDVVDLFDYIDLNKDNLLDLPELSERLFEA